MNDFVAKLIEIINLLPMISRELPQNKPKHLPSGQATTFPSNGESTKGASLRTKLEVISGLDATFGLRNLAGDTSIFLKLLRKLDDSLPADVALIKDHVANKNVDNACGITHSLRGAAGNLGLIQILDLATALELELRSPGPVGSVRAVERLFGELHFAVNRLHDQLSMIMD